MLRELDHHFDEKLTTTPGYYVRPWYARPAIWFGAIAAGGFVMVLLMLFLTAAP